MVLLGQGGGAFDPATSYPLPRGTQPRTLACEDLDADGALDLVASRFSALSVLRGTGNGAFFPEQALEISGNLRWGLAVADLDGDGASDLVTARLVEDEVVVLLQP